MAATGWVKLHRKIKDSAMWRSLNSKQRDVLITCLLLANHKPNTWEWQGELYECQVGEFITSLEALQKECATDVKIQSVRTALLKLEKWQFLTNKSTKTGRLISICNWNKYQDELTNELTKSQQSSNKALTTNKNDKNDKNRKEINKEKKFGSLKTLTPTVLQELATEKRISLKDCQTTYIQMKDWLESKGKTYRDYKAGLRNWINKKLEEGKIKHITPEVKREPIPTLTPEERAKNRERLEQLRKAHNL